MKVLVKDIVTETSVWTVSYAATLSSTDFWLRHIVTETSVSTLSGGSLF